MAGWVCFFFDSCIFHTAPPSSCLFLLIVVERQLVASSRPATLPGSHQDHPGNATLASMSA